jgi:hypothetical protein
MARDDQHDELALLLTTKSDLRELGTDLRAKIARQGADMWGEIAPVKADVLSLKWMMGFVLAFQLGIFAKLKALHALSLWSRSHVRGLRARRRRRAAAATGATIEAMETEMRIRPAFRAFPFPSRVSPFRSMFAAKDTKPCPPSRSTR